MSSRILVLKYLIPTDNINPHLECRKTLVPFHKRNVLFVILSLTTNIKSHDKCWAESPVNIHHMTIVGQFEQNTVQHCICCVIFGHSELIKSLKAIIIGIVCTNV